MPFVRMDVDSYDEILSEVDPEDLPPGAAENRPSGAFEYETAEAQFKPDKLGPIARMTLDALRELGATQFRIKYDGGYDEGFSHPDTLRFGDEERSFEQVADQLASAGLVARLRAQIATAPNRSMWGNASNMYQEAKDSQAVRYALDELAYELASRLLGDGFGTGEYQLYGAFTAHLTTGELTDDPDAPFPPNMEVG